MKILDILLEYLPAFESNSVAVLKSMQTCFAILNDYNKDKDTEKLLDIPRCPVSLIEDMYDKKGYNVHRAVWDELDLLEECYGATDENCTKCWARMLEIEIDKTNATIIIK